MDTNVRFPEDMIVTGKIYPVTVLAITQYGVIVQVDDTNFTAFIHISKVIRGFCNDPHDYVAVGDKLDAMGNTHGKKPELVLTHLDLPLKQRTELSAKVRQETKPIEPSAPVFGNPHVPKSLENMIEDANRSYKDKCSSKDKKQKPRRRIRRNKASQND